MYELLIICYTFSVRVPPKVIPKMHRSSFLGRGSNFHSGLMTVDTLIISNISFCNSKPLSIFESIKSKTKQSTELFIYYSTFPLNCNASIFYAKFK